MRPARMQSDEHTASVPQPSLTLPDSANICTSWAAVSSSSTRVTSTKPLLGSDPSTSTHITNDPFDYEQKYAPDEEHEEMSPKARVYRVYVDESAKFDREMVTGWREALDVLLVFAALFSAVVTTFVTQTCQSLQVDQAQVGNSLLSEMIGIQRIMLLVMVHGPEAVKAVQPAPTSFPTNASDFWVNGLWFASLGLSLATTLLAVLAKQWIHQYTLIQAGSPRDHSRIRHFRYMALQKWHVPLIIELLPVLMHAALGLFFLGLIIYLCSLSAAMAAIMTLIAFAAFGVYSVCNVLPIFYSDCAYKTPLALHSYSLFCSIRRRITTFTRRGADSLSRPPPSLSDIELERVIKQGHILDASTLGWLFNITPNLSVQSIVLQALSSLPLQNIPIIARGGLEGITSVVKAITDHSHVAQPVARFNRFQRAALRFEHQEPTVRVLAVCKEPSKYARLRQPLEAIQYITNILLGPEDPQTLAEMEFELDVVLWAKIISSALLSGTYWLRIHDDTPSRVWSELLRCAICVHDCDTSNCDGKKCPLLSFPLSSPSHPISIHGDPCDVSSKAQKRCYLQAALRSSMFPSFVKWVLHVGFPNARPSPADCTDTLPDDIFLYLTMLQTPSIQKTSTLHNTWIAGYEDATELERMSLFTRLLNVIGEYTLEMYVPSRHSQDTAKATIIAMKNVVLSDAFGTHELISLEDEVAIIKSLFQGLNRNIYRFGSRDHDFMWLTADTIRKVLRATLEDPEDACNGIANLLFYLLHSNTHAASLAIIYTGLLEQCWLEGLTGSLAYGWTYNGRDCPEVRPANRWSVLETGHLAALYVDGLSVLASHAPDVFHRVLDDLSRPEHLLTLCKALLLSDVQTQARLWEVARIVQVDHWERRTEELVVFAESRQAEEMYNEHLTFVYAGIGGSPTRSLLHGTSRSVAVAFAKDVARRWYAPPNYDGPTSTAPGAFHNFEADFAQWYQNKGVVEGQVY